VETIKAGQYEKAKLDSFMLGVEKLKKKRADTWKEHSDTAGHIKKDFLVRNLKQT